MALIVAAFLMAPALPYAHLHYNLTVSVSILVGLFSIIAIIAPFGKILGIIFACLLAFKGLWGTPNPDIGNVAAVGIGVTLLLGTIGGEMLFYGFNRDQASGMYNLMFYGIPVLGLIFAPLTWFASSDMWLSAIFVFAGLITPLIMLVTFPPPEPVSAK